MSIPDGTARYNTQKPTLGMNIPDKYRTRSYVNDVRLIEDHPPMAMPDEYEKPKKTQYSIHTSLQDKIYNAKSV